MTRWTRSFPDSVVRAAIHPFTADRANCSASRHCGSARTPILNWSNRRAQNLCAVQSRSKQPARCVSHCSRARYLSRWRTPAGASAGRILPRKRPRRPGSCLRRRPLHGRWPRSMTHRHGTGRIVFWNFSIRTPARLARSCSERTASACCNRTFCPARRALKRRFPSGKRSAAGNLTASRP